MFDPGVIPEFTMGDRLAKARSLTGMNARDFADHIGVSHKTVNNAESGRHAVRKIVINAWSMATGVPVEWLETGIAPTSDPDGGASGDGESGPPSTAKYQGWTPHLVAA